MMQHLPNQPVVVTVASPSYGRRENYSGKQALGLGAFQLILGGASFICQIAAIASGDPYSFTGAGIWGGILMMIAGGLGIGAAWRKANCLIVAVMVMSIIASISTTVIIGFAAASLRGRDFSWGYRDEYIPGTFVRRCYYASFPYYTTGSCITKRDTQCELRVVMNSILILCAVAELVIAIWASALCCSVTCCGSRPISSTVCLLTPPCQPEVAYLASCCSPAANERTSSGFPRSNITDMSDKKHWWAVRIAKHTIHRIRTGGGSCTAGSFWKYVLETTLKPRLSNKESQITARQHSTNSLLQATPILQTYR